jgi:hypothetical protein
MATSEGSSSRDPVIVRRPRWSLFVVAYALSLCVQAGDLGSVDTARRLRVAHSWWTHNPPVPSSDVGFGVVGSGGVVHAYYGAGQSVVMFPADVVGGTLLRLAGIREGDPREQRIRNAFVSFSTFPPISALIVVLAFDLLLALRFNRREAALGGMSILLVTSLLPYTQLNQENSLQLLLTLGAYVGVARWLNHRRPRQLAAAGACLGGNLLVRPVTALDALCVVVFGALMLEWRRSPSGASGTNVRGRVAWPRLPDLAAAISPVLAMVVIERVYQHHRFGDWTSTYFGVLCTQWRAAAPSLPPEFPFDGRFRDGFLGALFSPARSVLLFDAGIAVTALLIAGRWRLVDRSVRAFAASAGLLLLGTAAFYAKYHDWSGSSAWADRYCTTGSDLVGMLAVPLTMRLWPTLRGRVVRPALAAVLGYAVVVQLLGLMFWCNLEEAQCATAGASCPVILRRASNVATLLLGRPLADGNISARTATPNFFPFLVAPTLGHGAARAIQLLWACGCVAVAVGVVLLVRAWLHQPATAGPTLPQGRATDALA